MRALWIALAGALRKIETWSARVPMHAGAPATAHLFIINPFSAGGLFCADESFN